MFAYTESGSVWPATPTNTLTAPGGSYGYGDIFGEGLAVSSTICAGWCTGISGGDSSLRHLQRIVCRCGVFHGSGLRVPEKVQRFRGKGQTDLIQRRRLFSDVLLRRRRHGRRLLRLVGGNRGNYGGGQLPVGLAAAGTGRVDDLCALIDRGCLRVHQVGQHVDSEGRAFRSR